MTSKPDSHSCFFCGMPYGTQSALHTHLVTHVVSDCHCITCAPDTAVQWADKLFERRKRVKPSSQDKISISYLTKLHACKLKCKGEPYSCKHCGKGEDLNLKQYVEHMQLHAKSQQQRTRMILIRASMDKKNKGPFYCPKCNLPYTNHVAYIKHLKKHLIAIVRQSGIQERGKDYDFEGETYLNDGSGICPVTDCGIQIKGTINIILHMEQHLEDLNKIQNGRTSPDRGRPRLSPEPEEIAVKHRGMVYTRKKGSVVKEVDTDDPVEVVGPPKSSFWETCPDCGFEVAKDILVKHRIQTHRSKLSACPVCWQRISSADEIVEHLEKVHELTFD